MTRPVEVRRIKDEPGFYKGLVRGMRCGVVTMDGKRRLGLINDPAVRVLELGRRPEVGRPVEEALSERPEIARILIDSMGMSSLPNRAEIELTLPDGRRKTIGFTVSMVEADSGRPEGAAMFFKDLTHVEHREEQERLRDRLAALGQMAANLAHEIRNPLASIEVTCSLLRRRLPREGEGSELLEKIAGEVRRLNGTITSSLEFVRPISPSVGMWGLRPVLDEALRVAFGRRPSPEVHVEWAGADEIAPFLMDGEQVRQVFENLFLNALEAMDGHGTLRIECLIQPAPASPSTPYLPSGIDSARKPHRVDSFAVVRVTDSGPGIDEENLDKLFYPFFTTKRHGSGVGLAMARKVVDSHRGMMDVESTPGKGSTFTVHLPMALPESEDPAR